ncbi:unnamed protein product [Coffea canephora]|uniref:Uncharacterized protein n=1 Tax=Coffea canephora TaxID=49390 RepID=A0A068UR04_COFCA|nr:unnamed protein product [Coffea canephora]
MNQDGQVNPVGRYYSITLIALEENGSGGYPKDGTVDLKGNPVLRSKRGGWTACWFVVVYEVFERMAFCGISSNLFIYFTKKLHQGTLTSANTVTNWVGTVWMTPILGAYVADAAFGRYWTFVIASTIYLSIFILLIFNFIQYQGMSLLTLAVSVPGLKPPHCADPKGINCKKADTLQLAVFFAALYTLAVGTGGTKPNISTIAYFSGHCLPSLLLFGFKTMLAGLLVTGFLLLDLHILIFLAGTPFYRHIVPTGSPFTRMAQVIIASLRKWKVFVPTDQLGLEEYAKKGKVRIVSTPSMSQTRFFIAFDQFLFLDKACVKTTSTNPWMLCSVAQVEETKQMLRMIPILISTLGPSTMAAQGNTLFVKQGTTLNRRTGNFHIPPASLAAFVTRIHANLLGIIRSTLHENH